MAWHREVKELSMKKLKLDETTKVVLIDDQAKHGWADLLSGWIYKECPNKKIKPHDDVMAIIKDERSLEEFLEPRDQIIIFDLHLFPPQDRDRENRYFEQVKDLATQMGYKKTLINSSMLLIDKLTLLPRLMAKINPFIPIIIFSVTENLKSLSDLLCDYENIEVVSKPSILSRHDDEQQNLIGTRNNFMKKIETAVTFINKYSRPSKFARHFKGSQFPELNFPPFNKEDIRKLRVELYLDETGTAGISNEFTLGGIYVVGPNDKTAWTNFKNSSAWSNLKAGKEKLTDITNGIRLARRVSNAKKRTIRDIFCNQGLQSIISAPESGSFSINAIQLTSKRDAETPRPKLEDIIDATKDTIRNSEANINNIRGICTQQGPLPFDLNRFEKIVKKIGQDLLAGQIVENIFRDYCGWNIYYYTDQNQQQILQGDLNVEFNKILGNKQNLLAAMVQQQLERKRSHIEVLVDLVNLFLHVILPMLKNASSKDIQSASIKYGNITQPVHLPIANELVKYGYKHQHNNPGPIVRTYFVDTTTVSNQNELHNPKNVPITGVPDFEFCNLHWIADTVISPQNNQGFQKLVDSLYEYPGMKGDNLDVFKNVNNHFYNGKYTKAVESLVQDDNAWKAVDERVIENQKSPPQDNTAHSYICKILGQKADFSKLILDENERQRKGLVALLYQKLMRLFGKNKA